MIRVILESPYAGDILRNKLYLADCIRDSLARGEAPFASHGFYTDYLDDALPEQRALGIAAGFLWRDGAYQTVVYQDLGLSRGMIAGIVDSRRKGIPVVFRKLGGAWARSEDADGGNSEGESVT